MKELKFKTSKGKFVLVDAPLKDWEFVEFTKQLPIKERIKRVSLKQITEEQAKEVVFRIGHHSNEHLIPKAKEILFNLIKSKGVYLFRNPFTPQLNPIERKEAETKTFYNPYLFKL